jgi:hypothetical protein
MKLFVLIAISPLIFVILYPFIENILLSFVVEISFKSNDLKILDDKINFIIDVLKEKELIEDEQN